MFALLKQIDPPLGFGSKCPDLLAYKRLVRMNMPVDIEGKVHFKTTLFALVRINLQIFLRSMDEMDQADQELRAAISKIWPFVKRDGSIDIIVPPSEGTYSHIYFPKEIKSQLSQISFGIPNPRRSLPVWGHLFVKSAI